MKKRMKLQDDESAYMWNLDDDFAIWPRPGQSMEEFVAELRRAADKLESGEFTFD